MRHFRLQLKDEAVRGMTRKQYYAASHWARYTGWLMDTKLINWDKFRERFLDVVLYGQSDLTYEDMLL